MTNDEIGISTTAETTAALSASQGTGYTLSNIGFQIERQRETLRDSYSGDGSESEQTEQASGC